MSTTETLNTRKLARTNSGTFIHLAACHMANRKGNRAMAWDWANTVPLARVEVEALRGNYRVCRHCNPLAFTPGPRHRPRTAYPRYERPRP